MNYKMIGTTLAFQTSKGKQWKEVSYEELVRLALLGLRLGGGLTQHAAGGLLRPVCDFEQKTDEVCEVLDAVAPCANCGHLKNVH